MTMEAAQIRAILGSAIKGDGVLDTEKGPSFFWKPKDGTVMMAGEFALEEIEAIAAHMRAHGAK